MSMQIIDYLALSQLAYVNFTNDDTGQALGKIIDMANDENSGYQREGLNPHGSTLAALQSPSNPLRSWKVIAQSTSSFTHTITQRGHTRKVTVEIPFSATAFQNPETGEIVFAFRGTNNTGDWGTDIQIGIGDPDFFIEQFQLAKKFVYDTLNRHGQICYETQEAMFKALNQNSNVSFTGHSLGGGLAQYLSNLFSKRSGLYA